MTNAEKLAKDTDLMATIVKLYCKTQHDCTKCVLAENQCCAINMHVGLVDFLESRQNNMTNAEKLAQNTDFMKKMIVLYCGKKSDCKKCKLAKNQSCLMHEYEGIADFLESEAKDNDH